MSIYEYDAEKHMAMERTEAYERGIKLAKSVIKLHKEGKTDEEIVKECNTTLEKVRMILE